MIVLDASAAIEWLLRSPAGQKVEQRIYARRDSLAAPHLLDVECTQVLRRFTLSAALSAQRAGEAMEELLDLPISRYPHDLLVVRAWELRQNLTIYAGMYVALAELLRAPLVTCDGRLGSASGHNAQVEVI